MSKKRPQNVSEVLLSGRTSKRVEALYVLMVTTTDGFEGIVRRDTVVGTIPFITDDAELVARMLELAKETPAEIGSPSIAVFKRVESISEVRREPDHLEEVRRRLERGERIERVGDAFFGKPE